MKNSNELNVPQAREAMDKFKMQAAQDVDVPVTYWTIESTYQKQNQQTISKQ